MITIKKRNLNIRINHLLLISLFFAYKISDSKDFNFQNKINIKQCKLTEAEFSVMEIFPNNTLVKSILSDFEVNKDLHQIIYLFGKSGTGDFTVYKWDEFKNNGYRFTELSNKSRPKNIIVNDVFFAPQIARNKSYIKDCGNCYDCYYNLILIKAENKVFKYYYVGEMYGGLNSEDKNKIYEECDLIFKLRKQ
ncbi:hypothetical protein GR160_05905 [Flavobacterium sp. Sd200]|uniref:hypothetical protein n=1 Tax=Flavobacterium sp. Sd200 TaxID=2692211 RepID=UPI0013711CA4|nr:hypothetical protein [Flavobacterium sp. Sd200]MXN90755.1 hypothetical protein [Flavobacterium sp. Sd200]